MIAHHRSDENTGTALEQWLDINIRARANPAMHALHGRIMDDDRNSSSDCPSLDTDVKLRTVGAKSNLLLLDYI